MTSMARSLRTRVVTILLAVFVASVSLELAIQHLVVYPRFLELERAQVTRNVERAVEALQRELDLLIPSIKDWALWDDAYRFVQDHNSEFVAANLNPQALQALAVQVLAFYDQKGERIWYGTNDLSSETARELIHLIPQALSTDHFLGRRDATDAALAGLFHTPQGTFLVVSKPTLPSSGIGAPMGHVLMARFLDAAAIARLGEQARVDLRVMLPEPGSQPLISTQEPGRLIRTAIRLQEMPDKTVGETTLMDVDGHPALTIQVTTPREITQRGQDALWLASLSLGVAGGLALVTLLILLRRLVLDPLSSLTAHATALGASDDFRVRLQSNRMDEIGVLAQAFDLMTERLAQARQRLLEQSYRAGIAEMASGVLHNLGNAITPVGVKLTHLQASLRDAPVEEMDLALAELAAPTTDPERRADMLDFLQLAGQELAALARRLTHELEGVQTQVEHVQQILVDQARFSRAERVSESIAVHALLEDTVQLLPENLRDLVKIDIDSSLRQMPPVQAARVVLQQVVSNLLINAAESMGSDPGQPPPLPGVVHISAQHEMLEDAPMVHLRVVDNGCGIAVTDLPHIFERGFSTKSRGSGMGLHWTANTLLAMGGRIDAESAGLGQGTCLHLWLPQAVAGDDARNNNA